LKFFNRKGKTKVFAEDAKLNYLQQLSVFLCVSSLALLAVYTNSACRDFFNRKEKTKVFAEDAKPRSLQQLFVFLCGSSFATFAVN
jgi:hypothetical protein